MWHLWPPWSIVLGRAVDYLSISISLSDCILVCMIISWLPSSIRRIITFLSTHKLSIVLYAVAIALNTLSSTNPIATMWTWSSSLTLVMFALYVWDTKPRTETVATILGASSLLFGLIAIAQLVLQHSLGGVFYFLGERAFTVDTAGIARTQYTLPWPISTSTGMLLRPYSTFPHPNVLGGFMASVFFVIAGAKHSLGKYRTFMLCFISFIVLISGSRAAIGTLGLFLIARQVVGNVHQKTSALLLLLPFFLTLLALLVISRTTLDESVIVRWQLVRTSLQLFLTHPVTGVGAGTFLINLPEVMPMRSIFYLQPVHNIFLLFLAENGILGVLSAFHLFSMFRSFLRKHKTTFLRNYYLYPMLCLVILGLIDHYPITIEQTQMLLTFVVVMWASNAVHTPRATITA